MNRFELRDRCVSLIYGEALGTTEAVEKVLADVELDGATAAELVREGLRHLVDGALTKDRGRRPEHPGEDDRTSGSAVRSGKFQHRPDQHELSGRFYWLSKSYATEAGPQRPILEFSREDVAGVLSFASMQASEWSARERLWSRIGSELDGRPRAKRVADLPVKVLVELDGLAGSVLGGVAA